MIFITQRERVFAYLSLLALAHCSLPPQGSRPPAPPPALQALGLSGTAIIKVWVLPSGHITDAKLYKSSGIRMIDEYALQQVKAASFPPFNGQATQTVLLPVNVEPSSTGN